MRSAAAGLVVLMACSSNPRSKAPPATARPPEATKVTPPPESTTTSVFSRAPHQAEPRSEVPAALQPLLPHQGIYAAGGGLTSTPWRIIVELDGKGGGKLRSAQGDKPNAPSFGPLPEVVKTLDAAAVRDLVACADRAWREQRSDTPHPTADYDELLIVADGDDTFTLDGYGPIKGGAAAECIEHLRALRPYK